MLPKIIIINLGVAAQHARFIIAFVWLILY